MEKSFWRVLPSSIFQFNSLNFIALGVLSEERAIIFLNDGKILILLHFQMAEDDFNVQILIWPLQQRSVNLEILQHSISKACHERDAEL